ncbi:MAG TPA: hypothetical protein VID03_09880 [Acidimicrobiia bacterium]|jgi:hypothetical protein
MALIFEWGFFVEAGRVDEFEAWLGLNEEKLAAVAPPQYEYLGTYVPLWAPGGRGGDFHQIWRYGHALRFDFRDAAANTGGEFTELARQYLSFVDSSRESEETFRLHRSVTDGDTPA